MIGKSFKAQKTNVLDLYERYQSKRSHHLDGIDIEFWDRRVESLKNGKYTLAVAGEVKAGKSTFVNALIGAEILPSDVLQASNAIVEIFKSDKSYLKVTYASGKVEEIYDDLSTIDINESKERLRNICSISEDYRDIPTTLIDQDIINSEEDITITKELIDYWESNSSMRLEDKQQTIERYVNERTRHTIPTEIQFGYPLKWEFDALRIVDTPGVNATGGVQNISLRYFDRADAILFVHPIKPIESESFNRFVSHNIPQRSKDTLFLILTHAGLYPTSDVNKLHEEAIRLYGDLISKNRVIVVDSLLKLIHNDLSNGQNLEFIRTSSEQKSDILPKFLERANGKPEELKSILLDYSRFEELFKAIENFAMDAPKIQLREILNTIKNGYDHLEIQYSEKIERLESKKRNPQEFELEIGRLIDALDIYKLESSKTAHELNSSYTGTHSDWAKEISDLKTKYPKLILSAENFDLVKKYMLEARDESETKMNDFSKNVQISINEHLQVANREFKKSYRVTPPSIDIQALRKKSEEMAYKNKYEKITEGLFENWNIFKFNWSKTSRTKTVLVGKEYDKEKHLAEFKAECNLAFRDFTDDLHKKSKEILQKYLDSFSKEMSQAIQDRQVALREESIKKQKNEEILDEIDEYEQKKKEIPNELTSIKEIIGALS
jgi:hypothetical protein